MPTVLELWMMASKVWVMSAMESISTWDVLKLLPRTAVLAHSCLTIQRLCGRWSLHSAHRVLFQFVQKSVFCRPSRRHCHSSICSLNLGYPCWRSMVENAERKRTVDPLIWIWSASSNNITISTTDWAFPSFAMGIQWHCRSMHLHSKETFIWSHDCG